MPRQQRSSGNCRKQRRVLGAGHLGLGQAVDVVGGTRVDPVGDALTDPALEPGRMVGTDTDVLVHVEDDRLGPGNAGEGADGIDEGELGVAGGEHGVGLAPRRHRLPQDAGRRLGGGFGQALGRPVDLDSEHVDPAGDHRSCPADPEPAPAGASEGTVLVRATSANQPALGLARRSKVLRSTWWRPKVGR